MEDIKQKTIELIDALKATCRDFGMGNDGNEYKVITQVFLYKFLNDKFGYEAKKISPELKEAESWEIAYSAMSDNEIDDLFDSLSPDVLRLRPEHLVSNLWNQQKKGDFDLIFDNTMLDIADKNAAIFSTQTSNNTKIPLFETLTTNVTDDAQRAPFARALIDKLVRFSFEEAFSKSYDFFATVFEYLIKDYNTAGGGKYAEYYTPHSIATIMARLLVGDSTDLHNIECYDPSAGTGTLLMALAHQIGEDRCTIFAQDISQKSNKMLKLNLILNGLVSSLDHAIQGDTLLSPYHKSDDGKTLRQFDYVVSNPPFKMDFADNQPTLKTFKSRFWAGVPNITPKKKDKMAIYTLFIQHVINSLRDKSGKGAVVVPTGFLTAQGSIDFEIRKKLVDERMLKGVISMPPNIFANTGTNVSVLFIDKANTDGNVTLIDASKLGEKIKQDNNQKTILRDDEIESIIDTFYNQKAIDDFSVVVTYEQLEEKKYSFSAGQYFEVRIEYEDISSEEFVTTMKKYQVELKNLFERSHELENSIFTSLQELENANS